MTDLAPPITRISDYVAATRERIARLLEHGVSLRRVARAARVSDSTLKPWFCEDWNPTTLTLDALEEAMTSLEDALLPKDVVLPDRPGTGLTFSQRMRMAMDSGGGAWRTENLRQRARKSKLPKALREDQAAAADAA